MAVPTKEELRALLAERLLGQAGLESWDPSHTDDVHDILLGLLIGNMGGGSGGGGPVAVADVTGLVAALSAKAPVASPTFTGTVAGVTKTHVGLGNVDNTSDANKPVSSAQQTALNLKANLVSPTFTGTVGGVTKAHVGLGSVDNTADTAKPVSTAQATAIAAKAPITNVRLDVYATAADTWPSKASALPSGFTGRVNWDHTQFGPTDVPPPEIAANDFKTDLEPAP